MCKHIPDPMTLPEKLEAIIFDMDGVVINSEHLHERSSRLVFGAHGIEIDESIFTDFKGSTDRTILEYLVKAHALDLEVDELLQQKRSTYASLVDELEMIEGVMDFLQQVSAVYRLALTTSASHQNKELAFQKFDLYHFFENVVTSNDITNPKPDPEPYRLTTSQLALAPENCMVIEDSYNGVLSAAGAGCYVVGITTSFDAPSLKKAGASMVIDGYPELAAVLKLAG